MAASQPTPRERARIRQALAAAAVGLAALAGCGVRPELAAPEPGTLEAVRRLGGGRACAGTVAATLDALRVDAADLERLVVSARTSGAGDHEVLQSWDTWVYRTGQPGALVVRSSPDCRLLTAYPVGGATLPGA